MICLCAVANILIENTYQDFIDTLRDHTFSQFNTFSTYINIATYRKELIRFGNFRRDNGRKTIIKKIGENVLSWSQYNFPNFLNYCY